MMTFSPETVIDIGIAPSKLKKFHLKKNMNQLLNSKEKLTQITTIILLKNYLNI